MEEESIVRQNLMDDVNYRPYCGSNISRTEPGGCDNPRVKYREIDGQFICPKCGLISQFPQDFIDRYQKKHNLKLTQQQYIMDPKAILTVQQAKEFFSATHEFQVTEESDSLNISYTDDIDNTTTSVSLWKERINIQQLIRKMKQLVWNHCNGVLD